MSTPNNVVNKEDVAVCSQYKVDSYLGTDSIPSSQLDVELEASRNKSPVTVQEWIDSLPLITECGPRDECDTTVLSNLNPNSEAETDVFTLGAEAGHMCARKTSISSPVNVTITSCPESSEIDSHCSSVDSLLEARKPDPEEILLSLGFGGTASSSYLETGRVPKRFLSPSQLKGVDIDEFIRQQQDLIYTFESGFYGYRGLAGPSYSNPSVIVAKILEKLRDHEKESALMNTYPPDFRKRCSVDQSAVENQPRKFSKVARNVLTKIRCTPGSVLSPDNRRWLDNQGNKSPEIVRRLILGQQSFTFGHDGDLIESFNASTSNRNESSDSGFERNPRHFNKSNVVETVGILCQNSGKNSDDQDLSSPVENTVNTNSSSKNNIILSRAVSENKSCANESTCLGKPADSFQSRVLGSSVHSKLIRSSASIPENPTYDNKIIRSLKEIRTNPSVDLKSTTNKTLSLHEEIDESSRTSDEVDVNANTMTESKSGLTKAGSHDGHGKNSDDEFTSRVKLDENRYSDITNEFSDSATESEFATYTRGRFVNKNICEQYEDFILLESKIEQHLGKLSESITREQFVSLSTAQRSSMQSRVIREALEMYLHQLREDDINIELKNCLSNEVRKVFDLVDGSSDSSKLATIVRQMILLLQQQNRLSAQIKELSLVDAKPSSCNNMCNHLLRRVQDLEVLVEQNAQELAHMKNQLLGKK